MTTAAVRNRRLVARVGRIRRRARASVSTTLVSLLNPRGHPVEELRETEFRFLGCAGAPVLARRLVFIGVGLRCSLLRHHRGHVARGLRCEAGRS